MSANDSTSGGTLIADEPLAKIRPGKNESKRDFVGRCISAMADEGVEDNDQRVAMCHSMWEQSMKKRETVLKAAELLVNEYDGEDAEHGQLAAPIQLVKAVEEDGRLFVEGVVLRANTTDRQGDSISPEEIRKSCYSYMRDSQSADVMHRKILSSDDATLVENFIVHKNMKRNGVQLLEHDWFVKFEVLSEPLKKMVREGKLNSFSISGRGRAADDFEES